MEALVFAYVRGEVFDENRKIKIKSNTETIADLKKVVKSECQRIKIDADLIQVYADAVGVCRR